MPSEIDPDERLYEGWEPSPVPARTPNDPLPSPPRISLPQVVAPTLCEQGPCANYHMAVIRFDAATPMDGSDDVMHTQTIRTCIPGPGVTLELEDRPVFECTKWDPDTNLQSSLELRREEFDASPAGAQYQAKLAAWHADQQRIHEEIERELAAPPKPDVSVLDAMIAELQPGDVLELRVKGKPLLLAKLEQAGQLYCGYRLPDGTEADFIQKCDGELTEAFVATFGYGNTYQLRRVNSAGAIVSTRLYTIDTPKETPTP